jgi:radical SAM superfamily enzyme YgiQ (UPF0313 family)
LNFAGPLVEKLKCDSVIVGPFASINPEKTLLKSKVITKLVSGEFERPIEDILSGRKNSDIANLSYREDGKIKTNPPRPYMTGEELDKVPFVSKFFNEHIDIKRYKTISEPYPFIDMMTGRGCKWGMCTYCLWVHTFIKGMTYNVRSIPNVIEEFKYIETEMPQIKSVMIQDDTFTEERAKEFSEAKIKAGIKLRWSCYARANMTYETLQLMKKAGCLNLHVGYESADPAVLKAIKKGVTVEMMTKFTADAKRAGLHIHGDFAIGFPGETPEGAMKTIKWACKMNPESAQFQLMIPFPGTPFYEEMKSKGWLNANGQPDMPQFSNAEIRKMAKRAYRSFYISPRHVIKVLKNPQEHLFGKIKTIRRAIPAMLWKKWQV